jgi:hypothetical protein
MKIRIRWTDAQTLAAENRKLKSDLEFAACSALALAHEVVGLRAELAILRAEDCESCVDRSEVGNNRPAQRERT